MLIQERRPALVARILRVVLPIKLDDQTNGATKEVGDIRTNRHLAYEFEPTELPPAQPVPQPAFSIGLLASKSPRPRRSAAASLRDVRPKAHRRSQALQARPPRSCLSPPGRGRVRARARNRVRGAAANSHSGGALHPRQSFVRLRSQALVMRAIRRFGPPHPVASRLDLSPLGRGVWVALNPHRNAPRAVLAGRALRRQGIPASPGCRACGRAAGPN